MIYPSTTVDACKSRWLDIVSCFVSEYGNYDDIRLFSAPGRVELGGNHTDHQHGRVLAAAVSSDAAGAAAINGSRIIRIHTKGHDPDIVNLDDVSCNISDYGKSVALVRGIASRFIELGYAVSGFDAYTVSDVPRGSGMSSSAAFEVLVGTIINRLFCNGAVSPVEIAKIGKYAENEYFGKPCGLMDQTASVVGGIISIDFNDPEQPLVERIDCGFEGFTICITETGGDHADLTGEYAAIPFEMTSVAEFFGEKHLRHVSVEKFFESIPEVRNALGDRAILRAIHFFEENERTIAEADALKNRDLLRFIDLINESGRSSWMHLQNISEPGAIKNQPVALVLALSDKLLGSKGAVRVHGGGFAGTIQAFVPTDMIGEYICGIERVTGKATCRVAVIRSTGGTELYA